MALEVWKEKVNDDYMSDNGMAARNFVNHLLPFLATIILQDSVRLWMYLSRGKVSLKQLGWDGKTQFRYSKRRDVAMWVKTVAKNVHGNTYDWLDNSDIIIKIAAILDEERGKDTVLIALQKFKDGSPLSWIKRRSKKTLYDSTSNNVGHQIQFTESTDTESESDNLPLSSLTR